MFENAVGIVPVLYRRHDVSFEDFSTYWCEVHGVFVAAFLGPRRYRMLHFAPYDSQLWGSAAVDRTLTAERQLGGIAEFIFDKDDDRNSWSNEIGTFANADDGVVFRRSASYSVPKGGFRMTKVAGQRLEGDGFHIFVMLQAREAGEAFHDYVAKVLGPAFASISGVLHVQTTSHSPYQAPINDVSGGDAVDRALHPDEQHQATIEIVSKDEAVFGEFFERDFKNLEENFVKQVTAVHAYLVKTGYTHIQDAKVTLTGWLGATRADLVKRVKAENILELLDAANERRLAAALCAHKA